jgi:hypothetical protein
MPTFYRGPFTELWITLRSDEVLGVLDSDYLEDYFGADGQVTLRYQDGTFYTVLMNEVTEETPGVAHDVFTGPVDLSTIPDGIYTIQGRVRDVVGNYTILDEVETPLGDERIINLTFTVSSTGPPSNLVVSVGPVKLMGGITLEMQFEPTPDFVLSFENPVFDVSLMSGVEFDAPLLGE